MGYHLKRFMVNEDENGISSKTIHGEGGWGWGSYKMIHG
jgi:hypothetical protein